MLLIPTCPLEKPVFVAQVGRRVLNLYSDCVVPMNRLYRLLMSVKEDWSMELQMSNWMSRWPETAVIEEVDFAYTKATGRRVKTFSGGFFAQTHPVLSVPYPPCP